jgi:hypothetical protein
MSSETTKDVPDSGENHQKSIRLSGVVVGVLIALIVGGVVGYVIHSSSTSPTATTSTTTTTPVASLSCPQKSQASFVQANSVTVNPDHSADVSGFTASFVCGGPDDGHYVVSTTPVTVDLEPGAAITTLDQTLNFASVPTSVDDLTYYLQANPDGNIFYVVGPQNAATGFVAEFHP